METRGRDQKYLALIWAIQNNQSNAIATPRSLARKQFPHRVYRTWVGRKWLYTVAPIESTVIENMEQKKGGRPKVLTEEQCRQLREWHADGVSNREIARKFKVSEGTIRNFLREKTGERFEVQKSP